MKVVVLLPVYKPSKSLIQQLDSLYNQSFSNFNVIIGDDSPNDDALKLIENHQLFLEERIKYNKNNKNLGVKNNILQLLKHSDHDYIFLCDQDDIWEFNKIQLFIEKSNEFTDFISKPYLFHSDLILVDAEGKEISRSMWSYQYLNPQKMKRLETLLIHNFVTGCASMINRPMRNLIIKSSSIQDAVMHDHLIAILAQIFGSIITISQPTIYYRQHGSNQIGAQNYNLKYVWGKIRSIFNNTDLQNSIEDAILQSKLILSEYSDILPNEEKNILEAFSKLSNRGGITKRRIFLKLKIRKFGFARNIGLFLRIR